MILVAGRQVSVSVKLPVTVMPLTERPLGERLIIVMGCAELVVPATCEPKVKDAVEMPGRPCAETRGAAVPVRMKRARKVGKAELLPALRNSARWLLRFGPQTFRKRVSFMARSLSVDLNVRGQISRNAAPTNAPARW
jgi:hypothetical protein